MAYSLLVMLFSAALAWMLDLYGRMPWGNVRPSKTDLKHVSTASPVTKLSLKYRTASRWGASLVSGQFLFQFGFLDPQ